MTNPLKNSTAEVRGSNIKRWRCVRKCDPQCFFGVAIPSQVVKGELAGWGSYGQYVKRGWSGTVSTPIGDALGSSTQLGWGNLETAREISCVRSTSELFSSHYSLKLWCVHWWIISRLFALNGTSHLSDTTIRIFCRFFWRLHPSWRGAILAAAGPRVFREQRSLLLQILLLLLLLLLLHNFRLEWQSLTHS